MRLQRIAASDLRKQPALVGDALAEVGFFPGPRVVLVEDATDTHAPVLLATLKDRRPGDPVLVVTAGGLTGKSALKSGFEAAMNAVAIGLYDDPPSRAEVEAMLAKSGLPLPDATAMGELMLLSRELEPGDFRQTVEKLALFKLGDESPLTPAEIHALAPNAGEADEMDLAQAVAEGAAGRIGPLIRRLQAQGTQAVGLCISCQRFFRGLHAAASDPAGPGVGIKKTYGFGNRRDAMAGLAGRWPLAQLEVALQVLVEADLTLRSTSRAPGMAVLERALLKIAMLKGARR